jgi:hypothetical protein
MGLGRIFKYLDNDFQKDIILKAEKDIQFSLGLGFGLGYIFTYLSDELQKQGSFLRKQRTICNLLLVLVVA